MKNIILILVLLSAYTTALCQNAADFHTSTITANNIVCSSFINDDEGWLADNAGNVCHTADAAQSWSIVSTENFFVKIAFTSPVIGYALSASQAYKTNDGGVNWSPLALPNDITPAIYFISPQTGFISGQNAIYKTVDGGDSWSTISTDTTTFNYFYFITSVTGFATAYDDQFFKCIWRTDDGGSTWSNVYDSSNYFMNAIWFTSANEGWAAGYYDRTGLGKLPVINHSTDGGATWQMAFIDDHPEDIKGDQFIDVRFKNGLDGFALSIYDQSFITVDGGQTWNLTYGENGKLLPSYGVFNSLAGYSTMYFTGRNGYVTAWK
ncbi:MAG: hypothetical protein ABIQ74_14355 [Chitinophagales bacterium]